MSEPDALHLLMPALSYPNCGVRQARLTQICRALLLHAEGQSERVAQEISTGWREQDEEAAFVTHAKAMPAQPI